MSAKVVNYIQTKRKNRGKILHFIQTNKAIWGNKTPAIQTNYRSLYGWLSVVYIVQGGLIFLLVEEEVFFGGVVGPDVLDAFVGFAFVFDFLEVFDYFEGAPERWA